MPDRDRRGPEGSHTLVIVNRDRFIDELQSLAACHAGSKDGNAVEHAIQIVADPTRYQFRDHEADAGDAQHKV